MFLECRGSPRIDARAPFANFAQTQACKHLILILIVITPVTKRQSFSRLFNSCDHCHSAVFSKDRHPSNYEALPPTQQAQQTIINTVRALTVQRVRSVDFDELQTTASHTILFGFLQQVKVRILKNIAELRLSSFTAKREMDQSSQHQHTESCRQGCRLGLEPEPGRWGVRPEMASASCRRDAVTVPQGAAGSKVCSHPPQQDPPCLDSRGRGRFTGRGRFIE